MRPSTPHSLGARLVGGLAGLTALVVLSTACRNLEQTSSATPETPVEIRGRELFATHCTVCHGPEGRADGPGSPYLFPPARDLGRGQFRLVSSENGAAFDRDLVATLRRGMPGSAMPAFEWLPGEDLSALAGHVRRLAVSGLAEELGFQAAERGESTPDAQLLARATERLTPRSELPPVPPAANTKEARERGAKLYAQYCTACHAQDGSGEPEPTRNPDGSLNWARDLTAGFLKGSASREALAHRIGAGLPGTAMPGLHFDDPADLAALVDHVSRLLPEGTEERLVLRRRTLRVRRIAGSVPDDPADARWEQHPTVVLRLAPLWWREDSVHELSVSALHDGESIALRIAWTDSTRETRLFSDTLRSDAAALQFSSAEGPPRFGMGSPEQPTSIWHWRSLPLSEVAGRLDLLESPHLSSDGRLESVRVDVPVYHRLEGIPPVSTRVERLRPRGVGSAHETERLSTSVRIHPRAAEDGWQVVFVRPLATPDEPGLVFEPGAPTQFAAALWNGAAGHEGPKKAVSLWHELALDP